MSEDNRIEEYQSARYACEMAQNFLKQHDFKKLIADINTADAIGPMVDPTLWMQKGQAMLEDKEVFAAAQKFLSTWEKRR